MHSQVVVLGGGPGGYAAAFMAADLGMQVTIVEADSRLGGTCLLRGCIPSKALLHVAKVISEARDMGEWGVSFGKMKLDVDTMRARKEKVIDTLTGGLAQLAKRRNVRVVNARGIFVDSQTLQLEGGNPETYESQRITFDHCILATGSVPAMPKMFSIGSPRVMDSTGALKLEEVPKSLLVIGGGYIGLEMGTVYAELGSKVTVVELLDGLLPGADRDLVKPLHKRLEKLFAKIYLETKVLGLEDTGKQVEVQVEGADGKETLTFDRVLVSVGRRPVSTGLGLENTKVTINKRGFVEVNDRQETSDPHILAIGDVAGDPMLAHKASHEGKVAAEVLAGEPAAFDKAAIPAVVFTEPEIAWAGLTADEAKRDGIKVEIAQYPWQASGRAIAIGKTDGLTKWLVDPETDRVLGCGIVGTGAGELIAEAVVAIEMGCTMRDVAESIHPHPTLSETVAFAGEVYLGTATEVYRPKRKKTEDS
ncbi:dihydrolipoyl dehydrogenase [Bythopirellula polymerisocia]|uniref:Dihydrolipoyl dehydrogenase n=1 Tax=Bythopirellula polymerisocia TaxID=2528003 RepID=A0A5C6D4Q7_9BACT|nr:dihydrolipoyl dehydrogenase [Bythopirellula polymerisocia]TWU30186.1 Dihydrolipoyl dehydrogenase [Bythopirellula polymerisocia]